MRLPGKFSQRNDWLFGKLWPAEVDLAKLVFKDTIPYERIYIANVGSPTGAITVADSQYATHADYLLLWSGAYDVNIGTTPGLQNTFIHELTHVWQSQNAGFAMAYMAQSFKAQLKNGIKDILEGGRDKAFQKIKEMIKDGIIDKWNIHRDRTYRFTEQDIGKNFDDFNVEQQAMIVETWFSGSQITGADNFMYPARGLRSPKDPRYPYIRDCIRAKSPKAPYVAVQNQPGYSAEIERMQAVLFSLGYLKDEKYVDGYWGAITKNAVTEFQKYNNLRQDGEARPAHSLTRKTLLESELKILVRSPK